MNQTIRRAAAMLLALCMTLLFPLSVLAEETPFIPFDQTRIALSVESSAGSADPGEEINVQVRVTANSGFRTLTLQPVFSEGLDLVAGTVAKGTVANADGFSFSSAGGTAATGILVSFSVKIADSAPIGDGSVGFRVTALTDASGSTLPTAYAVVTPLAVTVLAHDYIADEVPATCTEAGYTRYTCSRCGAEYSIEKAQALGHNWGAASYVWSPDSSTCTASRVCANDPTHTETETVEAASSVVDGKTVYTASFKNEAFELQTNTVGKILWGDANGDGAVNNKDIVRLKNYLANYDDATGKPTRDIYPGADANGDGVKNNKDVVRLKNYLMNFDEETGNSNVPLGPAVGKPLSGIPDYSLPEGATADQMRAMAVQAMRDELTVQWRIENDLTYTYGTQNYPLKAAETYAGLPYTGGGTGLLQWLQYYDFKTGRVDGLTLNESNNYLGGNLGNSCAASVFWGWSSVCSSINGNSTYYMTPGRGCLPVDGYTVDPNLMSYKEYPTKKIVEDNTKERIYKAYAATLPGDGLISYKSADDSTAHARMVVSEPYVVKYANGNIDPAGSYLYIQDQHKGQRVTSASSNPWSIVEEDGQILHYAGHTYQKFTFEDLINDYYIPVAPAELLGKKAYTVPDAEASYTGTIQRVSDLRKITIAATHKIITVKAMVMKDNAVVEDSNYIRITQSTNDAGLFTFSLATTNTASSNYFPLPKLPAAGGDYTLKLEVLLASGTTHTVLDVPIIVG